MRRAFAPLLVGLLLLTGVGSASADESTALAVGGSAVGMVEGADRSATFTIDLDLAERVRLSIDAPADGLTARLFRPGADEPRSTLRLKPGTTTAEVVADWPGRWTITVTGDATTAVAVTAAQLAPGTPGEVAGATTIDDADGIIVGTTYVTTTLDAERPASTRGRFLLVQAEAGDRGLIRVVSTNGRPLRAEVLRPGTTDARVERDEPVATLTTSTAATLTFDADIDGQWIVRLAPAADDEGAVRPATATVQLVGVTPRDPATTCVDDITDIGLVKVRGCVRTGRTAVTATGAISMSGVDIIPLGSAPLRIDPRTLEVTSDGDFAVDILGMRVLSATDYFLLRGTRTFTVPKDTQLLGVPVTGRLTAEWSLERGGSVDVDGTARLPGLGVGGDLSFGVSADDGVRRLRIAVDVADLKGIGFEGALAYRRVLAGGEFANVWRGNLDVTIGAAPAELAGVGGALEIRDGQLAYLRAAVGTRIPIGSTGIFVTRLGAGLRWNPSFAIDGTGTIALGPPVNGLSALAITGEAGWASDEPCPGSPSSGSKWHGSGRAVIASWFTILDLSACYQRSDTPYVVVSGQSGFGIENILTGTARFDGYVIGDRAMLLDAKAQMTVWGLGVDGRVVLANAGYAACGTAFVNVFGAKRRVELGASGTWSGGEKRVAFACPDFTPFTMLPEGRSTRTDGVALRVPAGVDQVNLLVRGDAAVPAIDIVGPSGEVVARTTSTSDPTTEGAIFVPGTDGRTMQVVLPITTPGMFRLVPQAGSGISSVATSLPRPDPTVRARIVRTTRGLVVRYTTRDLDGRRVRLTDETRRTVRVLGSVTGASGEFRLRGTAPRTISATILDERGIPQAPIVVARWRTGS